MNLEEFLSSEPSLAALRKEIDAADRHELRLLKGDEGALVQLLSAHWRMGVMGWMTPEEGAQVAAELTADAERQRIAGRAEVRDRWLVFAGGRHGEQFLLLSGTSPIRARKHFPGYLEACPPVRPTTLLGRLGAQLGAQLDLLGRASGWSSGKRGQR